VTSQEERLGPSGRQTSITAIRNLHMLPHNLNVRFASAVAAVIVFASAATTALAAPAKNIVIVHGAWVDGAGWKPVYEILTNDGYHVSVVQEPLISLEDDVATTKRILDLEKGPCILVAHSYGGSFITEAGIHPNVVGLVYVAAHAPDVGEDEGALGKRMPSATQTKRSG
jgi:pimeloyl-ACP methyl ester carboxylesterase